MGSNTGADLDIRIWDVERGSAAYVKAGVRDVVIDCGARAGGDMGFSPLDHIRSQYSVDNVDYMIVSHPHYDHIMDLSVAAERGYRPDMVTQPGSAVPIIRRKIDEEEPKGRDRYVKAAKEYIHLSEYNLQPSIYPSNPAWASGNYLADGGTSEGITFHSYSTEALIGDSDFRRLNNLSIITVINCNGFKYVTMGDILTDGIEELVDDSECVNEIMDADVLVAPHHGKESSFAKPLVEHINPDLVVISEKSEGEDEKHTVPEKYATIANGANVLHENTESVTERQVLTTRNDGRIRIQANARGEWLASVYGRGYAKLAAARQ